MSDTLLALIAFIVGLIVGLLVAWYYWRQRIKDCEAQTYSLRAAIQEKDKSLKDLKARIKGQGQAAASLGTAAVPSRAGAPSVPVTKPEPDNLQLIEGIGPKISKVLENVGITTFAQLAGAEVGHLEHVLSEAGMTLANPSTWPEQASLAAAGDWEALEVLQDELKGGRRV
jgi:predicted flap endonuclease-1-like 5' DNA nuclease